MKNRFFAAIAGFALLGGAAFADETATAFDGTWNTVLTCSNSYGALGYVFQFPAVVKNGVLHGEKGVKDEAGWFTIDGNIGRDGKATLLADGLVGGAQYAVGQRPKGTQYDYHIDATFSGNSGSGHRVEGRPCSVAFTKQ